MVNCRRQRTSGVKHELGMRVACLFGDGWHLGVIDALSAGSTAMLSSTGSTATVRFDDGETFYGLNLNFKEWSRTSP